MMNNEEFERKMAFIVEQQAQFAVDIQQMRELQAETENVVGQLAHATLEGFKDVNVKIDSLVDSQIRMTEAQTHTDQGLKDVNVKIDSLVDSQIRLTEAQTHTDQNLTNLIVVVDRYFSEGRN